MPATKTKLVVAAATVCVIAFASGLARAPANGCGAATKVHSNCPPPPLRVVTRR